MMLPPQFSKVLIPVVLVHLAVILLMGMVLENAPTVDSHQKQNRFGLPNAASGALPDTIRTSLSDADRAGVDSALFPENSHAPPNSGLKPGPVAGPRSLMVEKNGGTSGETSEMAREAKALPRTEVPQPPSQAEQQTPRLSPKTPPGAGEPIPRARRFRPIMVEKS